MKYYVTVKKKHLKFRFKKANPKMLNVKGEFKVVCLICNRYSVAGKTQHTIPSSLIVTVSP